MIIIYGIIITEMSMIVKGKDPEKKGSETSKASVLIMVCSELGVGGG